MTTIDLGGPALERSNFNPSYDKDPTAFRDFVKATGLSDSRGVNGDFLLTRDHTYRHYDGSTSRLDYNFTSNGRATMSLETKPFNRISTGHRILTARHNIFELVRGWKSPLIPFVYPKPFSVNRIDKSEDEAFEKCEEEWLKSVDPVLYAEICSGAEDETTPSEEKQEAFLKILNKLLVEDAERIWSHPSFQKGHKRSKEEGILIGKLTWIRRAINAAYSLRKNESDNKFDTFKINSLNKCISTSGLLSELTLKDWRNQSTSEQDAWLEEVKKARGILNRELLDVEIKHREERRDKAQSFFLREGAKNSKIFRRWRLREVCDPDGEAVLSSSDEILVAADLVMKRYEEYYGSLFQGEDSRKVPRDETKRSIWMDPKVIASNKSKLNKALNNVSIASILPTFEEYLEIVNNGDPMSTGGADRIQYGTLQKVSEGVHKAIFGLICIWWRQRSIPKTLRWVEIVSLHKRGDRLNLFNKRGIGLVSKLVLIIETILCNRMTKALEKAGTRSKAQGGAVKGIHTLDTITALINVVAHARRNSKPLHILEFDLYKFFDRIPHRAFVDAHIFFGFDEDTIQLASIFWSGFSGTARTRYGYTSSFPIGLGNIQGLAGSPFRSSLVLDMYLLILERRLHGYHFVTDHHHKVRDHNLDDLVVLIYAIAWVDDIWVIDEDYGKIVAAAAMYNDFVDYYTMKLVIDKCHHYVLNDNIAEGEEIVITDYDGNQGKVPVITSEKAFRCLGVHLNLDLEWGEHVEQVSLKLRDFNAKLSKRWAPAHLTSNLVNSNAVPVIAYGLPVVELNKKENGVLQDLLIKPVATDGGHNKFVARKAYCQAIKDGGYNITDVEAIHKASKAAFVHRVLNGNYYFATVTLRMMLLDLQREAKELNYPFSGLFTNWRPTFKNAYPRYIKTAASVLKQTEAAVLPGETWDLARISIQTFALCVAGWHTESNILDQLAEHGIIRMTQLSPWFAITESFDNKQISPVMKALVLNNPVSDLEVAKNPIYNNISNLHGIGPVRLTVLNKLVVDGIRNIFLTKPKV